MSQLTLTVLGSGTSIPSPERLQPSFHLQAADGQQLLLDVGAGSTFRLAQAGLQDVALEHIYISHTHQDHIAGLLPLLQGLESQDRAVVTQPLRIYGPESVKNYFDQAVALGMISAPSLPLEFSVLNDGDRFEVGSLEATTRLMHHSRDCFGIRLQMNETVFVYSADTGPCSAIYELAKGADLLLIEASFPSDCDSGFHLNNSAVGEIAVAAGVRSLILTHLYPENLELSASTIDSQVRSSGYTGMLHVASDLDIIPIRSVTL